MNMRSDISDAGACGSCSPFAACVADYLVMQSGF
jgi:hypothetical protein